MSVCPYFEGRRETNRRSVVEKCSIRVNDRICRSTNTRDWSTTDALRDEQRRRTCRWDRRDADWTIDDEEKMKVKWHSERTSVEWSMLDHEEWEVPTACRREKVHFHLHRLESTRSTWRDSYSIDQTKAKVREWTREDHLHHHEQEEEEDEGETNSKWNSVCSIERSIRCCRKRKSRIVRESHLLVRQCIRRECLERHEDGGCFHLEFLSNIQMNVQSFTQKRRQFIHLLCHLTRHSFLKGEISTLFDRCWCRIVGISNEDRYVEQDEKRREKLISPKFDQSDSKSVS
jgi:hypothetical protein